MSENTFSDSLVCCGGEVGVVRAFPQGDEECDPVGGEPARVVISCLENISSVGELAVFAVVRWSLVCWCQVSEDGRLGYMNGRVVLVDDVDS